MFTRPLAALLAGLLLVGLSGCKSAETDDQSDSRMPPTFGACRALTPADLAVPTNDSPEVPCAKPHTAETFLVSSFTEDQAEGGLDDKRLGAFVYDACQSAFVTFVGGDESLVMRSTLTWAWFRPSEKGWEDGARWFRCDAVGGGEQSKRFVELPETAKGVLLGKPEDQWLVCASGETVTGAVKIPCSQAHDWRAISTVQLGKPEDAYPGDREVEVKSRAFCSDQVAAWLSYPADDYDFGFTWFRRGEWKAGNRRSICWAKTDQ